MVLHDWIACVYLDAWVSRLPLDGPQKSPSVAHCLHPRMSFSPV